jgi:hypothetical protein
MLCGVRAETFPLLIAQTTARRFLLDPVHRARLGYERRRRDDVEQTNEAARGPRDEIADEPTDGPGYSSAPPAPSDTIPAAEYVDEDGPASVRSLSEMVEAIERKRR